MANDERYVDRVINALGPYANAMAEGIVRSAAIISNSTTCSIASDDSLQSQLWLIGALSSEVNCCRACSTNCRSQCMYVYLQQMQQCILTRIPSQLLLVFSCAHAFIISVASCNTFVALQLLQSIRKGNKFCSYYVECRFSLKCLLHAADCRLLERLLATLHFQAGEIIFEFCCQPAAQWGIGSG